MLRATSSVHSDFDAGLRSAQRPRGALIDPAGAARRASQGCAAEAYAAKESMKLTEARDGQCLEVIAVEGTAASLQALRFGIDAGSKITVQKNIAGGPVIISKNQLEIAIGREIALAISVTERQPL